MVYQMMFAVITPALITGPFAERLRFSAFLLFIAAVGLAGLRPVAHWVWGDRRVDPGLGALDFAGGTVVHITSGVSALAAALVMGRRKGLRPEQMPPHNLPMTVIGAAILWFGWFGFNAGSALGAGRARRERLRHDQHWRRRPPRSRGCSRSGATRGKPTVLGAASGARRRAGGDHAGLRVRHAAFRDR